jgi:hypothetical protein
MKSSYVWRSSFGSRQAACRGSTPLTEDMGRHVQAHFLYAIMELWRPELYDDTQQLYFGIASHL